MNCNEVIMEEEEDISTLRHAKNEERIITEPEVHNYSSFDEATNQLMQVKFNNNRKALLT